MKSHVMNGGRGDGMWKQVRLAIVGVSLLALGAAACSETWEGAKEDTKENVKTTGQGVEKAGENIQKQVQ
jgi:predicted small secreted protein